MINYSIYSEHNLILAIFHGVITPKQLHEFIDKLLNIDFADSEVRGLVILSENVKSDGLDYKEILAAGEKMRTAKFRANGKNAIVAETTLGYGLSRIYQVGTGSIGGDETKVYKKARLDDAIEWLGAGHLASQIHEEIQCYKTLDLDHSSNS